MVLFSCSTIRNDVNQLLSEVSSYFKETAVDNAKNTHKSSSSKKLRLLSMRKDVRKLLDAAKPIIIAYHALYDLLIWKRPLSSFMSLSIFLWTFTNGYLYGLILSLILAQLFINYMQTQRGITLGIVFWPVHDDQLKIFQLNNTEIMFEAIQWLQSVMKTLTGFLEAVNSLILWRHPAATEKFVIFIVILLWMTFVWPTNECLKIIASITITNAFFVVYLYQRFPRLRQEIDHLLKFYSQKACRRPTETECLLHSSSKSASLMHSFDEKAECRERSGQSADDYHASIPVDDSIWRTINDTQYSVKLRGRKNGICYTNEERCNFIRTVRSCYMVEGHECHARRADSGMLVLYTFGIFFFYDSSLPLQEQSIFVSLNDVIAVQSCSLPSKEVAKFVKRATTVGGKCLLIQITDEHQRKNTKLFVGITEIERLIGEIIEVAANTGHTVLPHI